MAEQELEAVIEIIERPDGTIGLGNTVAVTREEAISLIKGDKAKHELCARREVPELWAVRKKKKKLVGVVEEEEIKDEFYKS